MDVSIVEAEAFCKWVGCVVMINAEYHRILDFDKNRKKDQSIRGINWWWTSIEFEPFATFKPMQVYGKNCIE